MTYLHSLLLGLLQGLTEFFPVSSSAHLKMLKIILGIEEGADMHLLDLSCHLGTLLAALYFLRKDLWQILTQDRKKLLLFFVAMLPLLPAYFLLKPLREIASDTRYLGFCLMGTGLILFAGSYLRLPNRKSSLIKDSIYIGAMQSMALIPGISRSASTISCAKILGWKAEDAVRFSFLLSIPTILAGNSLEVLKTCLSSQPTCLLPLSSYLIAFAGALISGLMIVKAAMNILTRDKLKPFALYCLIAGLVAWALLGRG